MFNRLQNPNVPGMRGKINTFTFDKDTLERAGMGEAAGTQAPPFLVRGAGEGGGAGGRSGARAGRGRVAPGRGWEPARCAALGPQMRIRQDPPPPCAPGNVPSFHIGPPLCP